MTADTDFVGFLANKTERQGEQTQGFAVSAPFPRDPRASAMKRRTRDAEGITGDELAEFGIFSGLRAHVHVRIIVARFDLTESIGTWSIGGNVKTVHRTVSFRVLDPGGTAAKSPVAASSSTRDKKQNGALGP